MHYEVAAIAQSSRNFLFAALPVEAGTMHFLRGKPCRVGKARLRRQSWGDTALSDGAGHSHTRAAVSSPGKRQNHSGRLLAGGIVCAVASTQTDLFYGVAAASPSVWFPGWMEFEQQHPIQAQRVYLSLGNKEERTKNTIMAAVGDHIRTLHSRLTERGADCTLEWNSGGHFKDADLRTAKAFQWVIEEQA